MNRLMCNIFVGLLLIALISCSDDSEPVSVNIPEFNWTPEIILGPVGFQRFEVYINTPPEELRDYIRSFTVNASGVNGTTSAFSEVISMNNFFARQHYYPLSEALEELGEYRVSVTILYTDGTQKESNVVGFTVPETKGEVLSKQKIPNLWNGVPLSGLAIHGQSFFQFTGHDIVKYNAANGQVDIIESGDETGYATKFISLGEQKALIWRFVASLGSIYSFQILNMPTSTLSDPVEIEFGANIINIDLLCANDSLLLVYVESFTDISPIDRQFKLYDAETGELRKTFPRLPLDQPYNFGTFELVGDTLWRGYPAYFDSRLQRISLFTGEIQEEFALPVFFFDAMQYYDGYIWFRELSPFRETSTRALKVIGEAY